MSFTLVILPNLIGYRRQAAGLCSNLMQSYFIITQCLSLLFPESFTEHRAAGSLNLISGIADISEQNDNRNLGMNQSSSLVS